MRWFILKKLWIPFSERKISRHGAAAGFYILLSAVPAFALILTVMSILPDTLISPASGSLAILPQRLSIILTYLLSDISCRHPGASLSVWSVLTLWSASKGLLALSDGLKEITNISLKRNFLRRRLDAMVCFVLFVFLLLLTLVTQVFAQQTVYKLQTAFPFLSPLLSQFYRFRHLFALLPLVSILTCLFWLLSACSIPLRRCFPAGCITTVGLLVSSSGFSIYVNLRRSTGGLDLLLLLIIWLHVCICLLLSGLLLSELLIKKEYRPLQIIKEAVGKI